MPMARVQTKLIATTESKAQTITAYLEVIQERDLLQATSNTHNESGTLSVLELLNQCLRHLQTGTKEKRVKRLGPKEKKMEGKESKLRKRKLLEVLADWQGYEQ